MLLPLQEKSWLAGMPSRLSLGCSRRHTWLAYWDSDSPFEAWGGCSTGSLLKTDTPSASVVVALAGLRKQRQYDAKPALEHSGLAIHSASSFACRSSCGQAFGPRYKD